MKQQASAWAFLLIVFFFCVAFFGWMARDAFHVGWPSALLVGVAFFVFLMAIAWPSAIKEQMLKALPVDLVPVPVSPDDYAHLDRDELAEITAQLQALGFVTLCDYSTSVEAVVNTAIFARVMLHDEQDCIAEINQYFPPGRPWPISVHLQSFFGDAPHRMSFEARRAAPLPAPLPVPGAPDFKSLPGAEFWLYMTHNQRPYVLSRLWRHPHFIGRRMPGAAPSQLFAQHLADREKIAARLAMPPVHDLSIEHYFSWCRWTRGIYRQQLQRTNFYFALPRAYFDKRNEWWGELGRIEPLS